MDGVWHLVRLALRRDRFSLVAWIAALGVLPAFTAVAYEQLYPTAAGRAPLTELMGSNPALSVLFGQAFDLSTPGGFTAWRMLSFLGVFVAILGAFTVVRLTRAEEEAGRHELIAAGAVGRFAPLTAAVLVGGGACGLVGVLQAVTLAGVGTPLAGAVAFGAAVTSVGVVFTGAAAVAAQIFTRARAANFAVSGALGAVFLLRGIGDATSGSGWLSWLSPVGWAQQVRPYAGERWWVLALGFALGAMLIGAGYVLLTRRDAGSGLLTDRLGPASATGLRSPLALAWRLQRAPLLGWTFGFAVAGVAFGSIADGVTALFADSPQMLEIFRSFGGPGALIDAFLAQIAGMLAMVAALYGVAAALLMRDEETQVRLEPLLATRVSRLRWIGGHLLFALAGTTLLLVVGGLAAGLAHGVRSGDPGFVLAMLGGTLARLPAVWVVAGVAVLLFGLLPRRVAQAWSFAGMFIALALFGPVLDLPGFVLDLSPFRHVPQLPGGSLTAAPLLSLLAVAAAALGAGVYAFRQRDVG